VWGEGVYTDEHVEILRSRRKEGHIANGGVTRLDRGVMVSLF
jgi:hypothetical protein